MLKIICKKKGCDNMECEKLKKELAKANEEIIRLKNNSILNNIDLENLTLPNLIKCSNVLKTEKIIDILKGFESEKYYEYMNTCSYIHNITYS